MESTPIKETPQMKHYRMIRLKNERSKLAYADYCESARETKERKAYSDQLNAQLREFISRGPELQHIIEWLFSDTPSAPTDDKSGDEQSTPSDEATEQAGPPALPLCLPPDHWRLRPVKDLGMTELINEGLAKHDIETIGQLTDFWGAGKYLSELKEIGLEHYQQVTEAFSSYVERHREVLEGAPLADGEVAATRETDDTDAATYQGPGHPGEQWPADATPWRERKIEVLDIADYIVGALFQNDIETLGQLSTFWGKGGMLITLRGIAEKSADAVDAAWNAYVKSHPEVDAA